MKLDDRQAARSNRAFLTALSALTKGHRDTVDAPCQVWAEVDGEEVFSERVPCLLRKEQGYGKVSVYWEHGSLSERRFKKLGLAGTYATGYYNMDWPADDVLRIVDPETKTRIVIECRYEASFPVE